MSTEAEPDSLRTSPRKPTPVDGEDEQLMARVVARDETAFRLLVDRWEAPVLAYLIRTLGDREEARDLAQETFLRVHRHAHGYRAQGRFRSWLFRIAGNLARSRLRRRKIVRWLSLGSDEPVREPAAPRHREADQEYERNQLRQAIETALAELPPRQRMAFHLRRFEDLSYHEIAETLQCSESAVESLLVRATRSMQEKLRTAGFWDAP